MDARALRHTLPRAEFDVAAALDAVRPICDQVRDGGAAALLDLGERFDKVRPPRLRVPQEVLDAALEQLDPAVRAALEESIRRARLGKVFLDDLVGNGTVSSELAAFFRAAVAARKNIMISGATNAGKTTLLRAVANEIGAERVGLRISPEHNIQGVLEEDREEAGERGRVPQAVARGGLAGADVQAEVGAPQRREGELVARGVAREERGAHAELGSEAV